MKKFIVLCILVLGSMSFNNAYASDLLKNFYGYEVKNVNIREFGSAVKEYINAYDSPDKMQPLKSTPNTYIYTGNNSSYFIRLYPANNDTHIYVVANEKYDVTDNDVTQYLKKAGFEYSQLKDKKALKEYEFDFYGLARQEQLGNFYISPDLIKPLKTGMSKLNNKLAQNNEKTSVLPYSTDTNPIDLTCIDTTGHYDTPSKIAIVRREYRLKEKANKYVHAFEYILTNKNDKTVSITATSERLAGIKDIATETFVDLDRVDLLDTVGSFPPVVICTAGLSLLCSVPNWVRLAKTTKEATRYSHSLPENYQVRPNGHMRVLVLKYKNNPKPVNFHVTLENETFNISF